LTEAGNSAGSQDEHAAHTSEAIRNAALFENPEEQWPVVSRDVAEGRAAATLVYHDPEGGWWFDSEAGDPWVPQCLPCLLERHPALVQHADLPLNWVAWLEGGTWRRGPRPVEWGPWET
jgi:hypothetical protein